MKVNKFQRGQIWWYKTTNAYDGNVQGKTRPVIIISNYKANETSNNVMVVPCTTKVKNMYLPTHVEFLLNDIQNVALCETILTINKQKLDNYEGTCDLELMNKIEESIKIAIGLSPIPQKTSENIDNPDISSNDNIANVDLSTKPKGRKPKYNLDEMQRFVNDYSNHNIEYMMNKYNECSQKAVRSKVYRFKKILGGGD